MILIYPPVAKPCEPPAGIAKLSGALEHHGIKHSVLDANLEGQLFLMDSARENPQGSLDTWTARAMRNFTRNLGALKERNTYRSIDRYRRAVMDVNRVLEKSVANDEITISLANYQHDKLSPLRSEDLLKAAEMPELNPFYPYFQRRLSGLVEKEQPATIGFSLTYLSQALCTFAMLGFLKREYPGITLVCGGGLVTSWIRRPGQLVRDGYHNPFSGLVDRFIEGPGESALLSLAGIGADNKTHYTPDYDSMPFGEYISPGVILPYSGSSGCFWNRCSFCPEKAEGNCYVPVGIQRATADIDSLVRKTQPALIHLLDNSISTALMKSVIDNPPGAPWYGFARIEDELADMDFCMALKRSGCVMLKLGVESGDQYVLDRMQKGINLQTVSRALKTLKRAGIASYVYLLFGTPEENIAGARRTLDFTVKHSAEIGFLNLALFNMPIGSSDAREFKTGSFYEGDLSLYTGFEHPEGWDRKNVRQFIEGEFKRHPAIASILRKEPPLFTSNHAPFFAME
jgi:hypothetical protein